MQKDMKTIVYTSRVAESVADEQELLTQITTHAQQNNPAQSISGAMVLMNHHFLQILEGPIDNIEKLTEKIANDSRHTDFQVLFEEPILERSFAEWSMMSFQVAEPERFNVETLAALKQLYERNFTYRAEAFIELLKETLSDPELMRSMF